MPHPPRSWSSLGISSGFAFIALALIAIVQATLGNAILVGSLGGTSVIAFGMPDSAMAKSRSLLGGHALACCVGIVVSTMLPESPWAGALGVGIALGLMRITSTVHSPAGANPLMIAAAHGAWVHPTIVLVSGLLVLCALARLSAVVTRRSRRLHDRPADWA
jgi:CBS-domain-containing membrane protein